MHLSKEGITCIYINVHAYFFHALFYWQEGVPFSGYFSSTGGGLLLHQDLHNPGFVGMQVPTWELWNG